MLQGGPPLSPASPSPVRGICASSLTPAGMRTTRRPRCGWRPAPRHSLQGSVMMRPSPPHCWQVTTLTNWPKKLFWMRRTSPLPLQVEQRASWLPGSLPWPAQRGQGSLGGTSLPFSQPEAGASHAPLRVREHLVGFVDLLEAGFRPGLIVAVGVVLHSQLAEGFLDLFRAGRAGHAQDLVVVAL